jgi:hypothetical protein
VKIQPQWVVTPGKQTNKQTYITRLASNVIFYQSNKIHREVGGAKDLSALLYVIKECQGTEENTAAMTFSVPDS